MLRTDASYTAIITAISGCAEPCSHPTMNSAEIQARSADPFHRVDGSMMGPCAKLLRPGRPRHPGADRLQPLTCEHDCHQEGLTVLQTGRMTGGALWSSRRAYSAHPCSQAPRWGPSDPFPRRSPAEDCPLWRCPVSSHPSTEGLRSRGRVNGPHALRATLPDSRLETVWTRRAAAIDSSMASTTSA